MDYYYNFNSVNTKKQTGGTVGIYVDNPVNRRLGRVGLAYKKKKSKTSSIDINNKHLELIKHIKELKKDLSICKINYDMGIKLSKKDLLLRYNICKKYNTEFKLDIKHFTKQNLLGTKNNPTSGLLYLIIEKINNALKSKMQKLKTLEKNNKNLEKTGHTKKSKITADTPVKKLSRKKSSSNLTKITKKTKSSKKKDTKITKKEPTITSLKSTIFDKQSILSNLSDNRIIKSVQFIFDPHIISGKGVHIPPKNIIDYYKKTLNKLALKKRSTSRYIINSIDIKYDKNKDNYIFLYNVIAHKKVDLDLVSKIENLLVKLNLDNFKPLNYKNKKYVIGANILIYSRDIVKSKKTNKKILSTTKINRNIKNIDSNKKQPKRSITQSKKKSESKKSNTKSKKKI